MGWFLLLQGCQLLFAACLQQVFLTPCVFGSLGPCYYVTFPGFVFWSFFLALVECSSCWCVWHQLVWRECRSFAVLGVFRQVCYALVTVGLPEFCLCSTSQLELGILGVFLLSFPFGVEVPTVIWRLIALFFLLCGTMYKEVFQNVRQPILLFHVCCCHSCLLHLYFALICFIFFQNISRHWFFMSIHSHVLFLHC